MLHRRTHAGATGLGDLIIVAGGGAPYEDSVEIIDTRSGSSSVAHLSIPRSSLGVAAWDNYAVFAGGDVSVWLDPRRLTGRVDVLDLTTNSWAPQLELPVPVKYVGGGAIDGKAFFAGGITAGPSTASYAQILDLTTFTWTLYPLPGNPRSQIDVRTDDRWLCLVGGGGVQSNNHIDVYDSLTSTWQHTTTPTLTALNRGAVVDGSLYVVSCDPGPQEELMMILDLEAMTWSTVPRQGGRCGPYAGALDPFVVFASGRDQSSPWFIDTTDIYNTWTREWLTIPGGGILRTGATAVARTTGQLWIAGGQRDPASGLGSVAVSVLELAPHIGTAYCLATTPNSTGVPARMRAAGMTSITENYLTLAALDAPPGQLGLFLVGAQPALVVSPGGAPGNLCVGSAVGRLAGHVRTVDAEGRLAATIDLTQLPLGPTRSAVAGETLYFQAVMRDVPPGAPLHFSDALAITLTQ